VTPNYFGSLDISGFKSLPGILALTFSLKVQCRGKYHLFEQILCLDCSGYLLFAEQLHVILINLDKAKLTHLLRVAYMQPTWMHFKKVRQTSCTVMVNEWIRFLRHMMLVMAFSLNQNQNL
jgi:hypothetical protein